MIDERRTMPATTTSKPSKPVTMIKVKSSNLLEIGYNDATNTLFVRFIGNMLYSYDNVPPFMYLGLKASQSKGRFLSSQIVPFFRCHIVSQLDVNQVVQ